MRPDASGRFRVLYIAHTLAIGGAEELILNLMTHLPPDRWEPRVYCIESEGPIGREIRATGHPVTALGRVPGLRDPLAVIELVRTIRQARPHIAHTFLLTGNLYGRLAAILARVPVVIATEVNIYANKHLRHVLAERLLARGTHAVVASAQAVKAHYVRQVAVEPARVEVIYNAVDWAQLRTTASRAELRRRLSLPEDALVAGVIARLTEQKGHVDLLEAVARTPGLGDLFLVVVGDGPLRSVLEARAQALGLSSRVRFLGARRDLGDLLSAMDLFVLPSLWEGVPLALVLAMGAGLPVIAAAVGGIPEVVTDGATGVLVPPADGSALGLALARLASDATGRACLGKAAREFVLPRFSVSGYVKTVTALYERLLEGRAA